MNSYPNARGIPIASDKQAINTYATCPLNSYLRRGLQECVGDRFWCARLNPGSKTLRRQAGITPLGDCWNEGWVQEMSCHLPSARAQHASYDQLSDERSHTYVGDRTRVQNSATGSKERRQACVTFWAIVERRLGAACALLSA